MTTLTSSIRELGNLVIYELHGNYCRESAVLDAPAGTTADAYRVFGLPVGAFTRVSDNGGSVPIIIAGGEANAKGVCIEPKEKITLADGAATTVRYPVLMRGPAVINKNQLPATDPNGDAYNLDALAAALTAAGIVVRAEPSTVTTY
jgi:hypothetical protein